MDPDVLKGEVKRLHRGHFDICKLAGGSKELAHVWSVIEQMGIQLPETRSKRQLLPLGVSESSRVPEVSLQSRDAYPLLQRRF